MTALLLEKEVIGRGVFDRAKAKHPISPRVFRERLGVRELSVDRLCTADRSRLARLHAEARPGQAFHGWATLTVTQANSAGCAVVEDALPMNRWHALILISPEIADDVDRQNQLALALASMAAWEPTPPPQSLTSE